MTRSHLRITGDVHGLVHSYALSLQDCDYSIQLGDLGFNYDTLALLSPENHKFLGGNHDNYDVYYKSPHSLGDFGQFALGGLLFYFIRGAYSIDMLPRIHAERHGHPKCWWKEEQLKLDQMYKAYEDYRSVKPDTMLTHDCPSAISKFVGKPDVLRMFRIDPDTFSTPTQELLQECLDIHAPKIWIFGHYHTRRVFTYKKTVFVCLAGNDYVEVDQNGNFVNENFGVSIGKVK